MSNNYKQIIRFVFVGCMNTLNYWLLYLLFSHVFHFHHLTAHSIAFIVSMIGSFFMNTYFTYKTKVTLKKFLQFPLTYIVNFIITTVSIYVLVDVLNLNKDIAPLISSVIAIPFTFAISKKILVPKKEAMV
ncbi:Putative flippase GtrA (transmembrane translocase of bactoprenol-linked glucose) [Bacillus sp. 491mf]|uniref:GtrA family protein n=1 Tax=unclassified Bacillus (in: firmicutes) TaxID=185979 RepID=UPI00054D9B38|nr:MULTISPECIES: GtrA family protein [unclassified Bacillus (in: firmicutes)]SFC40182.1 Putative flippase GtrA (transmembrane translocase of bactoprenol-linked glucose) [Bacillus sp. 491mf]